MATQPARADCTTEAVDGKTTVTCTGDNTTRQQIFDNVDLFTNQGNIQVTGAVTALSVGTNTGDFINNGIISSSGGEAVRIGGMRTGAALTNNGTISTAGFSTHALNIAGPASIINNSIITAQSGTGNNYAITLGGGTVTNAVGAEIRGRAAGIQSASGTVAVENSGLIVATAGNAAYLGNGSSVTNSGTMEGTSNAIQIASNGTIINQLGGELTGTGTAFAVVMQTGSNTIENSGTIDVQGTSAGTTVSVVLLRSAADGLSTLTNTASGVIGHEGMVGANAVLGTGGGQLAISNAGIMYGGLDLSFSSAARTVHNGYDLTGAALSGPSAIHGSVLLGAGDDTVRNLGVINGDIELGGGNNTLINAVGGIINGNISGNNAISEDGVNHVVIAGTLKGFGTFGGVTTLELSGTLDGTIQLGGNDDTVIINGRPTFTGESKIDVGGSPGDTVIFRGNTGSFDPWRVNAEKMIKDGGGVTILGSEGATYWGGITIDEGTLIFGNSRTADEIVGDVTVKNGGTYALGGTHFGAVNIERGGLLIGTGRVSDGQYDEHDVVNDGIVAMGTPDSDQLGTLTFTSDYTQTAGGRLDIRLGAPGLSDLLEVAGVATLDGTVNFIPLSLANTGAYTFMTYGSHVGQFAQVLESGGSTGLFFSYQVEYQGDKAVVNIVKTATPPPPPPPAMGCTPGDPQPVRPSFANPRSAAATRSRRLISLLASKACSKPVRISR